MSTKPSARTIDPYEGMTEATDSRGRKIHYKELSFLDQTRIMRAVKPVDVKKEEFMSIAFLAAGVRFIDGHPQPSVKTEDQLDAAIDKLELDGFRALAAALDTGGPQQQTQEEFEDAVKNS